jgi:glucokinase
MSRFCIGIDLGGTFIKLGLLDRARRLHGLFQVETPGRQGAEAVVQRIVDSVQRLLEAQDVSRDQVVGIGIGAPGPLRISDGVIHAMPNIEGMQGCPIRDRISAGTMLPAVLENDANAAALGEAICGAGRDVESMILLTLGTGVGSGIVLNGRILHGDNEIGGEVGHMLVDPDGERCNCGQYGCLERYCSARFLAEYARGLIEERKVDGPLARRLSSRGRIDARDVNETRKEGDPVAEEAWRRATRYLAVGCINLCRIFDPSRIVLGGGLAKAGDDLLDPVRQQFADLHWALTEARTRIVLAEMGNEAGVIGAGAAAWRQCQPEPEQPGSARTNSVS